MHDFGEIIGSRILKEHVGERTHNTGFTNSALRLIKLLTPHLEENELQSMKKLLRKGIQKNTFEKYTLLDQQQRSKILNRYEQSNKAVVKKFVDSSSENLFPEMEDEYKTDFEGGISQEKMAVNLLLHFITCMKNRIGLKSVLKNSKRKNLLRNYR